MRTDALSFTALWHGGERGRCRFAGVVPIFLSSILACQPEQVIGEPGDCAETHEKIGWVGTFNRKLHDVAGEATVVNDCTIQVDMFNYDGLGITVELYAGLDGDFDGGFAMTGDLVRAQPYQDATVFAVLPSGRDLDDLDGLSVWCADVGVSFGDAVLEEPE